MATENLKTMKEQLMNCVQGQLGDLSKVDTHELGEAIDMIKDLAEAIYYCTITDSMKKSEDTKKESSTNINYYTTPMTSDMYYDPWRHSERNKGYMYYPGTGTEGGLRGNTATNTEAGNKNAMYYTEPYYKEMTRDPREGRAYLRRRTYMEGKERHNDTNSQLRELEAYLQELSSDITEMIKDASPEERSTLRQKMTTLASKIA